MTYSHHQPRLILPKLYKLSLPSLGAGAPASVGSAAMSLPTRILEEFRRSAIPDRLTLLNIEYVEGDAAVQLLAEEAIAQCQNVTSYITRPAQRILKRYEFARKGGWVSFGSLMDGTPAKVPCFKGFCPRKDLRNGKLKEVKYETPAKMRAAPILPLVDTQTAQEIYQRFEIAALPGESFWQVVWRCGLPIALTEGIKKALSLIAHGLPAIAVRGITQWHVKGSRELQSEIAQFATLGRVFYIAFDQDIKPRTRRDVTKQAIALGEALEKCDCTARFMTWEVKAGKGIDDVLYNLSQAGIDATERLAQYIQTAMDSRTYRRFGKVAAGLEIIDRLNTCSAQRERRSEGDYLPELPPLRRGAIHAILANMGSGKTTRIGQDYVAAARSNSSMGGSMTLVLVPNNSLGKQTALAYGLPHIHDYGTDKDSQSALWAEVFHKRGIVLCPDSLHRIPESFWQRPTLLVLDEGNQVIDHMTGGETLGSRYADIWQRFAAAARHAIATGAVVLSEASLTDRTINLMQRLTGCEDVRVFEHRRDAVPWDCTLYDNPSGYRAKLLAQLRQGDRLMVVTSSQREAQRLERAISKTTSGKRVIRIDSQTNEGGRFDHFFESPDAWLQAHQPDVLIVSPSAKSGISIEGGISAEESYFDSLWGYFPSLDTSTHLQMLGRLRPSVPRHIYVPPFILAGADEALLYPRAIARRRRANIEGIAKVFGIDIEVANRSEDMETIEDAILSYREVAIAVSGNQKAIARDALIHALESAGHQVTSRRGAYDAEVAELWKQVQEDIWRQEAQEIADIQLDPHQDLAWAYRALDGVDTSRKTRLEAYKVLWRDEFPGMLFDDAEEVYQCLIKDYGSMRRGVSLQAHAENLQAAKVADQAIAQSVLTADIRNPHQLPRRLMKATLIQQLGILSLLDGQTWCNSDPRAIAVKRAALHWSREIFYWLRLNIQESQTPSAIVNKLLKRLGLKAIAVSRPGKRGEQKERVYGIKDLDNPYRQRLLEASRGKLLETVSANSKGGKDSTDQITDTSASWPSSRQSDVPEATLAHPKVEGDRGHSPPYRDAGAG